ncbi:MAG TPA: hypothetical protein VGA99_05415 [bacterium]
MNPIPVVESVVCFSCGQATQNKYIFCESCTPAYGDAVLLENPKRKPRLMIFVGTIPFWKVIAARLNGLAPVKWWMGTDALTMWFTPPGKSSLMVAVHRIKMRILDFFIAHHWVVSPRLLADLQKSKLNLSKVAIAVHPPKYHAPIKKDHHQGFNILYYDPAEGKYSNWVYGIDIIDEIKDKLANVNWIRVDGRQNMKEIFPVVDLYIRPSRHDGAPRILLECAINCIPVIYSEDGHPNADDFVAKITAFKKGNLRSHP